MDTTALRSVPTRLILKLGDDLRQDMIVLRMLSLFEKVLSLSLSLFMSLSLCLSLVIFFLCHLVVGERGFA